MDFQEELVTLQVWHYSVLSILFILMIFYHMRLHHGSYIFSWVAEHFAIKLLLLVFGVAIKSRVFFFFFFFSWFKLNANFVGARMLIMKLLLRHTILTVYLLFLSSLTGNILFLLIKKIVLLFSFSRKVGNFMIFFYAGH